MRALARETVFKIIYKSLFLNGDLSYEEILEEEEITEDKDKNFNDDLSYIQEMISLYSENLDEINNVINSKLQTYSPDRVYRIDRAIIACATVELCYYKKTPVKVVVNEAVEIAKKYSTEKSYSFVNGILRSIIEDMVK